MRSEALLLELRKPHPAQIDSCNKKRHSLGGLRRFFVPILDFGSLREQVCKFAFLAI
jgi:hypothetical protein